MYVVFRSDKFITEFSLTFFTGYRLDRCTLEKGSGHIGKLDVDPG